MATARAHSRPLRPAGPRLSCPQKLCSRCTDLARGLTCSKRSRPGSSCSLRVWGAPLLPRDSRAAVGTGRKPDLTPALTNQQPTGQPKKKVFYSLKLHQQGPAGALGTPDQANRSNSMQTPKTKTSLDPQPARTGQRLQAKSKQSWTACKNKRLKQTPESPNVIYKTLRLQLKLMCRIKNQEKKNHS